jgi:hypothetical protein
MQLLGLQAGAEAASANLATTNTGGALPGLSGPCNR